MKRNRDLITNTNEYDLLKMIDDAIKYEDYKCIVEVMKDSRVYVIKSDGDKKRCIQSTEREGRVSCDECIRKWLNEESE